MTGTLTATNFNPGALSPSSLNVAGNSTVGGPRPYIDVTSPQYGATGDGGAEQATGAITSGSATLTVSSVTGTFQVGMYIHVNGAGASGDVLLAKITNISGSAFTLSRNAGTTVSGAAVQEDDTLPIQAAMVAFCAQSGASGGGSIYFPPGTTSFRSIKLPMRTPLPFPARLPRNAFSGRGGEIRERNVLLQAPQSSLIANCGAAPNAKAAFELDFPNGNDTSFDNLVIAGCNKAMYDAGANVVKLRNTWLSGGGTGTDASALHIADAFWFWMEGGGLQSSGTSVPSLLMTGDAGGGYTGVGNIYISNIISVGGPVQYIARTNINGAPSGHWVFRNWTWESGNGDLIQITNPSSFTMGSIGPITLDDVQIADNTANSPSLINFNPTTNVPLSGVTINNSFAGNKNWPAIRVVSGSINHYSIKGCSVGCTSLVVNSAGMPIGNGTMDSSAGFDSIADATDIARLINAPLGFANITGKGSGIRMTPSGSNFSTVGIDASNGLMFGISSQAGWNAQIFQGTAPNIDFAFAANYPPTAVSATMSNTGGSLGAGTVYGYVVSTTGADCSDSSKYSAPSAILGPYTLGTGVTTGSLTFAWTPAATGLIAINGYCVIGDSLGQYNSADPVSTMIAGASSTGATIGAFPGTPGPQPITRQMVAIDHLTPNSAIFNNVSLPVASAAPPYIPSCLASATCSAFAENSPFSADSFTRVNAASLGANWTQSFGSGGSAHRSQATRRRAIDERRIRFGLFLWPAIYCRSVLKGHGSHFHEWWERPLVSVAVRMASANAETFY